MEERKRRWKSGGRERIENERKVREEWEKKKQERK